MSKLRLRMISFLLIFLAGCTTTPEFEPFKPEPVYPSLDDCIYNCEYA